CLSVSEFFSELQNVTKQREPAIGGQGVRAYFFASFLWANKEMKAPSGGATPQSSSVVDPFEPVFWGHVTSTCLQNIQFCESPAYASIPEL
ncbi:MAG: hypothetical protein KAG12_07905, partial [Desulfuromusa sp.]|nr:hypothetical protein [Desulfuromusa sp.]